MRFATQDTYVGARPMQEYFLPANDLGFVAGSGPPQISMPMGTILKAWDPYWGAAEFIYVRANGTIPQFGLAIWAPAFNSTDGRYRYEATAAAGTANLGRPVGVALYAMAAAQYGWLFIEGLCPVDSTASIAAGTTFSNTASGQAGAATAGKQVLNAVIAAPATTTVAKSVSLTNGANIFRVTQANNIDGWFVGAILSGTGIPSATYITAFDPDGRTVTMTNNATASGSSTVTATYNDGTTYYNIACLDRPFLQGAIT